VAHTSETIGEEVRERLGQMTPSERQALLEKLQAMKQDDSSSS